MATIAQNLTQLATDKTSLAANLITKGVTAADTESMASLAGKVLDITGGGTTGTNVWGEM